MILVSMAKREQYRQLLLAKVRFSGQNTKFLLDYLDIYFCSELPYIDEIGKGKQHVLKEIMELADEM